MAPSTSPTSLSVTLSHVIKYLTRSVDAHFDLITVSKLRVALEAELSNAFARSWDPACPERGSGHRCLTINPVTLPPRAIYNACLAAGVQWADWSHLIAGSEFDMFIDPGCVSLRFGLNKPFTVYSARGTQSAPAPQSQRLAPRPTVAPLSLAANNFAASKTVAQQVCEAEDYDDLFLMIADEIAEPEWFTPLIESFPSVPKQPCRPAAALLGTRPSLSLAIPRHSRSSSSCSIASSEVSSGYSSCSTDSGYFGPRSLSPSSGSSPETPGSDYRSRRTRQREAKVFVDYTKKDVTPYDGGKTTVLGGGVMLGAPAPAAGHRRTHSKATTPSGTWRL